MLKTYFPVSQKVTVFRERAFKEITKKAGHGAVCMYSLHSGGRGRRIRVQGELNNMGACLKTTRSNSVKTELIMTGSMSKTTCIMKRDQDRDMRREEHVRTWKESSIRKSRRKKLSMGYLHLRTWSLWKAHLHCVSQLMCAVLLWQPEKLI